MQLGYAKQAISEIDEALAYYNAIDPVLSRKLVFEIDETLRLICAMPTAWKSIDDGIRQCRVKVFPYKFLYAYSFDIVSIIAFANTHRRPNYWRDRLI